MNIYASEYGLDNAALRDFADDVNTRNEPGSLHPRAPVSAVPRKLVRDAADSNALREQIADFLRTNEELIGAKKILFDFRTPEVSESIVSAINEALSAGASFLDEATIVE